jgi:uncharacterized OB-fold protein
MIEGKCPNCGRKYYGWALLEPDQQMCDHCGTRLRVFDGTKELFPISKVSDTKGDSPKQSKNKDIPKTDQ